MGNTIDDAKSTSTTSSRRKRSGPGFYAVKAGHKPGIYFSWSDTLQQVTGFKNPIHRRFDSLTEAEAFLANGTQSTRGSVQKFYAIQAGRVPGVYTDWASAKAQIDGWKGVKHKSFTTRAEAEAFVAAGKGITVAGLNANIKQDTETESQSSTAAVKKSSKVNETVAKKRKKNNGAASQIYTGPIEGVEPGTGPFPPDAEDGFDHSIALNPVTGKIEYKTDQQLNAKKLQPNGEIRGPIRIYTDGASRGNGKVGAVAGFGVYFGADDPRNVSERLEGPRQTNQRAELSAIQRAVDIAPIDVEVIICSDSQYSIKCVTEWYQNWRRNGWKTSSGKTVDNRDIIEPILTRLEERQKSGANTKFEWVRGHNNDPGNTAADYLAVQGALLPAVE
jgi:ribonuclease HI